MRSACLNSKKLKINQWQFLPNFWSSLATVLLFPLFVYLGFWQLQRMEFKQNLEAQRKLAIQQEPMTIQEWQNALQNRKSSKLLDSSGVSKTSKSLKTPKTLQAPDQMFPTDIIELFRYRHLSLVGTFLQNKNILLDNQVLNGQPGYRILTPFQANEHNILILVDRGFIPWGENRSKLPLIPEITEVIRITGMLTHLSQGFLLKEEAILAQELWPLQIQSLDYTKLSTKLRQTLYPVLLQLPHNSPYTFQSMPPSLGLTPSRHLGYAIQWFTMALAILIYYLVVNIKRR